MKKTLIAFFATIALSGTPALAADMALKAPPPPPPPTWTGIYIGGNIGGAWSRTSWCTDATLTTCAVPGVAPLDVISQSASGMVGGAQFGFRWQNPNNFVLGIEGMFDALSTSRTSLSCLSLAPPCGGVAFPGRTRSTFFRNLTDLTGSVGYAWGPFLLYGKGGWAATTMRLDANNTTPGGFDLAASQWVTGWTAGVGGEYMVWKNVSVGVEYDYYEFRPPNITSIFNTGGVLIPCAFCNFGTTSIQTVTGRINLKFGG